MCVDLKLRFRVLVVLAGLFLLNACSTNFIAESIDYKSAGEKKTPNLSFPPDLVAPTVDKRYTVQEGVATLSEYNSKNSKKPDQPTASSVTPTQAGMKVEKDGSNKRWLVVTKTPDELYPKVKSFWEDTGFLINVDSPNTGILETDWAENRAKIPQDFIRRNLGKVMDSLYSTGERDKFRTRLEKNDKGYTEIYITHRGAEERLVGNDAVTVTSSVWTARPSDPELEAEMISRLMIYLGASKEGSKEAVNDAKGLAVTKVSRITGSGADMALVLNQGFDRSWREIGLALDRSNFTVEDRDRSQGIYFTRFVNSKDFDSEKKPGFFSRLFTTSKADQLKQAKRYRILVKSSDANTTKVTVLDVDGKPEMSNVPPQILSIINNEVTQ
jgi:outer membrane protein assembly factor BamC